MKTDIMPVSAYIVVGLYITILFGINVPLKSIKYGKDVY